MFAKIVILFLLVQVPSEPLTIKVDEVEIETLIETIERRTVTVDGQELGKSSKVVSSETAKEKAHVVTVDSGDHPNYVDIFRTKPSYKDVTPIRLENGSYLVSGESAGTYTVKSLSFDGTQFNFEKFEFEIGDVPPSETGELAKMSAALAAQLADPPTQVALGLAIEKAAGEIGGDNVMKARESVWVAIYKVMEMRRGESMQKDWHGIWLKPIQAEITRLAPQTVGDYKNLILQVSTGLKP